MDATSFVTSGRCRSSICARPDGFRPSRDRRPVSLSTSLEVSSCSRLAALAASRTASGALLSPSLPSSSSRAVRSVVDAAAGFVSSKEATRGMNRDSEKSRVPRKTFSGDRFAVTSRSPRTCTTTNFTHALSASASISISADVSVLISAATSADAERDSASIGTSGGRSGGVSGDDDNPSACDATCDLQLLRSCRSAARTCGSARRR
mmetsp:Transcript_704/g.2678  ORF Transcript_704/g.2678 Transcript_704/m.2678 type:complete len:207 (-) Transcript_704:555-1175(-)